MKQFDICENLSAASKKRFPFVMILQTDFLDEIETCVVAPLARSEAFLAATRLNPSFEINGKNFVLSTPELAGVSRSSIGRTVVSRKEERDRIVGALDILFLGF